MNYVHLQLFYCSRQGVVSGREDDSCSTYLLLRKVIYMLLSMRSIKKSYKFHDVLMGVDLDINQGERIGIVGKNGAGKTTLANIIFGSLQPDEGYILREGTELKIGYLLQSVSYTVNTFSSMFDAADSRDIQNFAKTSSLLGLKSVQHWDEKRLGGLSGGEKTRVALAKVLATDPDLLILDEPTNHLDFQGVEWLADELLRFRGIVIVISHDRYFLDRVATRIVEIDEGRAYSYSGNYSFYRSEKKRRYEEQLHQFIEQEKRRGKIEAEVERLKMWSAKAHRESTAKTENKKGAKEYYRLSAKRMDRRIKSQIKRLERMKGNGVERPKDEPALSFMFEDAGKHGKRVLEARDIRKAYGARTLFENSSFFVQRGEKVGIFGPNGCGKTTLIKTILGMEKLNGGEIWLSPSALVTYVSQDVDDMDSDKTPLEVLGAGAGSKITRARTLLASMGIGGEMLSKAVKDMSLGERTRIKITGAILEGRDFLILDEPTNHLDLYSREQLEEALKGFEGTLLIISHDRYMLERVCNKMLVFENNRIFRIESGFKEWCERSGLLPETQKIRLKMTKEERLVMETRLAAVINKLSTLPKEDPEYEKLDAEYHDLVLKMKM